MRRLIARRDKATEDPRTTAPWVRTRLRTAPGAAFWLALLVALTAVTLAPLLVTADPARALREGGE